MQRRLPEVVHGVRDLEVEVGECAGSDSDRQEDERDPEDDDAEKAGC